MNILIRENRKQIDKLFHPSFKNKIKMFAKTANSNLKHRNIRVKVVDKEIKGGGRIYCKKEN